MIKEVNSLHSKWEKFAPLQVNNLQLRMVLMKMRRLCVHVLVVFLDLTW